MAGAVDAGVDDAAGLLSLAGAGFLLSSEALDLASGADSELVELFDA